MNRGLTLFEILIILAVVSITLTVSLPALNSFLTRSALVTASHEFLYTMRGIRQMAITRNRYVGVKFTFENGTLYYGVFMDGDADGIRTADIRRGIDPMVKPFTPMQFSHGRIRPGILNEEIPDISEKKKIHNPDDPVKFGRGNICSFSPLGASSPGTLYLTDGYDLQAAIRVFHLSALPRVMIYTPGRGWHRMGK